MLIMAMKPGHDGSIAVVEDGRLLWCLESEKDTYPRYAQLTPTTLLAVVERLDRVPDVVALGGWAKPRTGSPIGARVPGRRCRAAGPHALLRQGRRVLQLLS